MAGCDNGMPWEKLTPTWKKLTPPWTFFSTASISGGAADRENGGLRKKCHVVRKKTHVVRKIFYVASILTAERGRENEMLWKRKDCHPGMRRAGWRVGHGRKKREGTRLVVHPLSLVFRVMYFPAGKTLLVS